MRQRSGGQVVTSGGVEPSDSDLLFRLTKGDEQAYRLLFRRHERACYRVALAMVQSPWDAEEVVGAAFAELWKKRESVRIVDESVVPWLLTVVSYAAKNQLRGLRRYRRLLAKVPHDAPEPDHADEVARVVDAASVSAEVQAVLADLGARDSAVVVLCMVEGLTTRDAARTLGLPEGTVKSRLSRAKGRLRRSLSQYAPDTEGVTE
ncbi:RNA polymerase sigma-70 factor (ECF subfamily) [Microbacterium endophyticum]|uniref:RNA polymerase sigma-70 factor (ECF subfamily) n=1 Tax=Microbacterium endophyticum TaxID=1526412 RepID=A0A7W4V5D1_9MICO|nr:RNA polymerase sigma factor [Microbacterium endophyticum]MBB2977158.1 RNA polymerase sigma-70 factor (ECF subfamily) [Microbacterium endophyticum]NIK36086.1 RNA polymerase sigma-70 factor (ECF subfamily) [Microbacterium endophyticum]